MTSHRLNLPWAAPPLNLNDRYVHPVVQANAVAQVRRSTGWVAKAAKLGTHDRVQVTLHYRPAVARERDEDNLVATLKPCCDGLVDAKLVINDTPQHMVKLMPVIHEPDGPGALWLDIEILDGPDNAVEQAAGLIRQVFGGVDWPFDDADELAARALAAAGLLRTGMSAEVREHAEEIDWRAVALKLATAPDPDFSGLSTREADWVRAEVDHVRERDWSVQRERAQ